MFASWIQDFLSRKEEMVLKYIKGVIFLFLTVVGTLGNIFVSVKYLFSLLEGHEKKPIHFILIHLAFTNIISILAKGLLNLEAFGLRNFLDDIGCKIIVYLERVARGLSICTSSLLTVVQTIIISPRTSGWRRLRPKSAWHILPFFSCFWIFNSLISMNLLYYIKSTNSVNLTQVKKSGNYCYFLPESLITRWIFLILMVLRDAVFQCAMGGASGYMVFLLHKHHQHVLYLQNSKLLYRTPPELRAAQSVLLLMLCFVFFYWADCTFTLFISISSRHNSLIVNIREFLTLGYATFSPLVLIHSDGLLVGCWHAHWEKLRKCLSHLSV
ncbi:putative vomeronasal receptor-like protein 4 [Meriones unguiculatus]|uniref:putative vomeronasal receptor-like protein 4 n=1 Tax=Meriones unguiculatus TaxID=10047 RepID=UPI000B4F5646|nr:putative vomeronasal receptor-like protein 4 [Meriones unguiculatus]